jgi:apoptotic chromatin condensation inducer in the nucleus
MLSEYGHMVSFWMDSIKTHCYITYEDILQATEARNSLYNTVWPAITGRPLIAEFIQMETSGELSDTTQDYNHHRQSNKLAETTSDIAENTAMEQPPKTLNQLFMRTTTKPELYYLPLKKEQIEERQASRLTRI